MRTFRDNMNDPDPHKELTTMDWLLIVSLAGVVILLVYQTIVGW